jgi:hexosaminidase
VAQSSALITLFSFGDHDRKQRSPTPLISLAMPDVRISSLLSSGRSHQEGGASDGEARGSRPVNMRWLLPIVLGLAVPIAAARADSRPLTIPALREWNAGPGVLRLRASARVVVPRHDRRALRATAHVLAADLARLTGRRPRIVSGAARRGDVQLALGAGDPELGSEGYRLSIHRMVRIAANTTAGAFYGTRTLLQLVHRSRSLPAGVARDWPRYPQRGLMVDIGRKSFSLGWLRARIRELAYLKMNLLHLHFSDDQGWRIASDSHPEVVSARHLSKTDVRRLIALATAYHVTVVPEIDMPGHLGAALTHHPGLQLRSAVGARDRSALDYTLPAARRFVRELLDEYLDLFPGPYWHMGADEFPGALPSAVGTRPYPQLLADARARYGPRADAEDGYLGFINWVDSIVRAHGKTLRVWNDGLAGANVVRLNPDIIVEWWNNPSGPSSGPSPQDFIAAGHRVLNAGWFPTYYVVSLSEGRILTRPDIRRAYESWQVDEFYGVYSLLDAISDPPFTVAPTEPRNLGAALHEWNDSPKAETEGQIAAGIAPRLRVLAQKTWDSPELTPSYAEFKRVITAVGGAP